MVGKLFSNHKNDIILAPTPRAPRSKKPLLFAAGAVVLVVALIALVIVFSGNNHSTGRNNTTEISNAFSKFRGHILYNDSAKVPEEGVTYSSNRSAIMEALTERNAIFFVSAQKLYDDWLKTYNEEIDSASAPLLTSILADIKLLEAYVNIDLTKSDVLIEYYMQNGSDNTEARIRDFLSTFKEHDLATMDNGTTYNLLVDFFSKNLVALKELDAAGCFINHVINQKCEASGQVLSNQNKNDLIEAGEKLNQANSNMEEIARHTVELLEKIDRTINE